ncbi:translation initiation factor IF-2 [Candidatus Woesearchaeota archaeon]|nr:translation initiation factor IF-2 [Candidatus Woesearchaeota archaeon]
MLRKVLISVLGHVDHGKTSLLDRIRQTTVAEGEAGHITQSIGASIIPQETLKRVCGHLLKGQDIKIPGMLAIDTPGHAAFISLRKRGGALADIAILVVDMNEGFKPQTIEAIEILKSVKTPFIIAANKIDLLKGWQKKSDMLLQNISQQKPETIHDFENKLYQLVGKLAEVAGMNADRFDRVQDYTNQVAIVPLSAKTGEGIPELLMVLIGLAQKYLEKNLKVEVRGPAKGTILEYKEDKGLGQTVDVIMYDGSLHVNDTIILAGLNGPIVTKVKTLLEPYPHADMREHKTKYHSVRVVHAAAGVKISAKNIETALVGMSIISVPSNKSEDIERAKKIVQEQVSDVLFTKKEKGIIVKADSLGSLEAVERLLTEKNIPIRQAGIGNITRKDIIDAETNYEQDPLTSVILGFNVENPEELQTERVKVITSNIIYTILDDFEAWQAEQKRKQEAKELEAVTKPAKIQMLKDYIFRQSNPAIVGIEVLAGIVKNNTQLMNKKGEPVTTLKGLQHEKKAILQLEKGKQAAASLTNVTIGRQLQPDDILYTVITEKEFRILKEFKEFLSEDEKMALKEIVTIMRETNPVWGI